MISFIEILKLSAIQGVFEFLPVSSSAHLILFSKNQNLLIDLCLHLGSLLAILFFFRKDLINFNNNKKFLTKILLATLPIIFVGYFLYVTGIIYKLRSIEIIAWTTLVFGVVLYISDKKKITKKIGKNFQNKPAIIIGIFQILSLIPGVSRSGITITAGRFLGFSRTDASKISFFLAVPTLAASSVLGVYDLSQEGNNELNIMALISVVFSFVFAYLTIKFFLNYIKKFSLTIFVIYRLLISLILIYLIYL